MLRSLSAASKPYREAPGAQNTSTHTQLQCRVRLTKVGARKGQRRSEGYLGLEEQP